MSPARTYSTAELQRAWQQMPERCRGKSFEADMQDPITARLARMWAGVLARMEQARPPRAAVHAPAQRPATPLRTPRACTAFDPKRLAANDRDDD